MEPSALDRWAWLVAAVNGRAVLGSPGVRDPEAPCDGYAPGAPAGHEQHGCQGDGHYMCGECTHRATCPTCGYRPIDCEYYGCGAREGA